MVPTPTKDSSLQELVDCTTVWEFPLEFPVVSVSSKWKLWFLQPRMSIFSACNPSICTRRHRWHRCHLYFDVILWRLSSRAEDSVWCNNLLFLYYCCTAYIHIDKPLWFIYVSELRHSSVDVGTECWAFALHRINTVTNPNPKPDLNPNRKSGSVHELWCKNAGEPNAVSSRHYTALLFKAVLSVALVIRDPRLNGSRYLNALYSIRQSV